MASEEEKSCSSSSASTRWNPTREQISMLEAMYRQGIRTPTADEIQQIARKLREFGSIEGKNVFYWFQNHKARQRQKQKQESIACFNRFLRRAAAVSPVPFLPHPLSLPPPVCTSNNAVCGPYCHAHASLAIGYHPPLPNMLVPGLPPSIPTDSELQWIASTTNVRGGYVPIDSPRVKDAGSQETLQLFPLHPTGILEERSAISSIIHSTSTDSNTFSVEEAELQVAEEGGRGFGSKPVLNFL